MSKPTETPNPRVFTFHYTLKDDKGTVLDSSSGSEPLPFLEGHMQIVPGLESAMLFLNVGDKRNVEVKAADGYGDYNKEMVATVPIANFPEGGVKVGDRFTASSPEGHMQMVFVTEVNGDNVTVDANHPLAGKDLFFDIEVVSVRNASAEELQHGHVHGPGGHHH